MTHTNRLAGEQSAYLLQHKHNPVDWFPWGEEAFGRASEEDKPIFLSIGYATCHWCHVMERESFEDEEVAEILNESFISIKVDREERPDVDAIYMAVCQMLTGHGGWPMTVVLTPDRRPFFAATYLPKTGRFGRPGMMEVLPRLSAVWTEQRDDVLRSAEHLTGLLRRSGSSESGGESLDETTLHRAFAQLQERYDARRGGFGPPPKFPTPHNLLFLFRYWHQTGDEKALEMAVQTLIQMRLGGIYDHLGGGFHRYSTDARWLLPHFEKMAYDQALLAMAYAEAYHATREPLFKETAEEVFAYVGRDLTSDEGAFFSAEDADSEGREGKFYVWTVAEIRSVLGADAADAFIDVYGVLEEGNFEEEATRQRTGENVLHLVERPGALAARQDIDSHELESLLASSRKALLEERSRRVRPERDDKILTDWNGLMIASLALAARHVGQPSLSERASRAARFILTHLRTKDGRLLHRYRGGAAGIPAMADDYAFLTWGLIELYGATFEVEYLKHALRLAAEMDDLLWDEDRGGYFMAPATSGDLIVRQKELYDGATPSANSIQFSNLLRLARLTGDSWFEERAEQLIRFASPQVGEHPSAFTAFMLGLAFALSPSVEIVIAGEPTAAGTTNLIDRVWNTYNPNVVVLLRPVGDGLPEIVDVAPFVAEQTQIGDKPSAYVCRDFACEMPTTDPEVLTSLLERS